jgi:hypothetical protein
LIESLQRFHQYYGPDFKVECPTGSGEFMTLAGVAEEIQQRLIHIFARDNDGERACNGGSVRLNHDPQFRDYVQFGEYFNGDNGKALGATHQCGWTGWIAYAIWSTGHNARLPKTPRTPRSTAEHYFAGRCDARTLARADGGTFQNLFLPLQRRPTMASTCPILAQSWSRMSW